LRIQRETESEDAREDQQKYLILREEREAAKKEKHKNFATELIGQIVDFSITISNHNQITNKNIPIKRNGGKYLQFFNIFFINSIKKYCHAVFKVQTFVQNLTLNEFSVRRYSYYLNA